MSTHGGAVPVRGWRERFAGWTPRVVTAAGLWSLISIPLGQLGRPNIVVNRPSLRLSPRSCQLHTAIHVPMLRAGRGFHDVPARPLPQGRLPGCAVARLVPMRLQATWRGL